jgi:hypothetical protein
MNLLLLVLALPVSNPWADTVVHFDPGAGGSPGYDHPEVVLGPPTSMTGAGTQWPTVVSPFSPAWMPTEVVSIGIGGALTVRFDEPVADDPHNVHGIDLIIFGNAGCVDAAAPSGQCAGFFGGDGGRVLVSNDGVTWIHVPDVEADAPWPTMAWMDAGPYDDMAGTMPTDPTRGMDPALNPSQAIGLQYDELIVLYDTSAGGVGIDLTPLNLASVQWVRIEVDATAFLGVEIDAIVDAGHISGADLNGDGTVGVDDLLQLIAAWGSASGPADLNNDGIVGVDDLLLLLKAWS